MTKHSENCSMSFGRKSPLGECARCDELRAGAAPRAGWQKDYFARQTSDAQRREEIRAHFASHKHTSGGCGCVCTFGDW